MRHLVEYLEVDVRHHRSQEVLLGVVEEVYVVQDLRLPMHELAYFEHLRRVQLQEYATGQVVRLLQPEHLREANPVHQSEEGLVVERLFADFDDLYDKEEHVLVEGALQELVPVA